MPDVIGWLLSKGDRERLLGLVPPRYAQPVAHHVTLKPDATSEERAPPVREAAVVGVSDDGVGVQALVVELDGRTARPDGGVYHITWSLEPSRRAVESNAVIATHGWAPMDPMSIDLTPGRF
jgi:hypothetical protein